MFNLGRLMYFVKRGRLDASKTITVKDLYDAKCIKKIDFGVKILSKGAEEVNIPLKLEVSDASGSAIETVKKFGGSIEISWKSKLKMREYLKPHHFPLPLAEPMPHARIVNKLESLRDKGCKVTYNKPKWV